MIIAYLQVMVANHILLYFYHYSVPEYSLN